MMERLLYLRVWVEQGGATVWLNGIPVLRNARPGCPLALPVHEFLQTGSNQLRLQADDETVSRARAQLVLVRTGKPVDAADGRLLGDLALAGATEGTPAAAQASSELKVELPVNFPRWRWLDLIPGALANDTRGRLHDWLAALAADLQRGQFAGLLQQSRLRLEELAQAYQTDARTIQTRFSAHLAQLLKTMTHDRPRPMAEGR